MEAGEQAEQHDRNDEDPQEIAEQQIANERLCECPKGAVCVCLFIPASPLATSTSILLLHHAYEQKTALLPWASSPSGLSAGGPSRSSPVLFLFPTADSVDLSEWVQLTPLEKRTEPVLVVVDGTWSQALEMANNSLPFLSQFATCVSLGGECAMKCAEDCLKTLSNSILTACPEDVKFLSTRFDNKCMDRIQAVLSDGTFPKVSYTEAVECLQKASDHTFQTKVEWGITLSDEHQRYLVAEYQNKPIIVYNYPKDLKPFYSRLNDDTKTVSTFDIIFPKVGIVVCGIQKEERNYMISSRIKEVGLAEEQFDWYLDLRRHGTVKHAGFQINFDQLMVFLTGFGDIRDVVPFPRTKNDAKC